MGNQAKAYAAYLADYAVAHPVPAVKPTIENYFSDAGAAISKLTVGVEPQYHGAKIWGGAKVFFCASGEVVEESRTGGGAPVFAMFASRADWDFYHAPKSERVLFEQW